jgi:putative tricarboxylic transport membrane protein
MEPKKKKGDLISGVLFVCLGIGASIEAIRLQLGTFTQPQVGFFPFLSSLFLAVLAGILVIEALRGRSTGTKPFSIWGPHTALVLALGVYVAVFETIGYVLSTVPLGMVVLYVLGTKKAWILLGASLLSALTTYVLFDKILGVPLHNGILERFF